jgi:cytochrome P450
MTSSIDVPAPELPLARPRTAPLDPPPEYARLRTEQPITRVSIREGRLSPWLVTRYADARAVLGNPAFSSDQTRPGFPSSRENSPPAPRGFFLAYDDPVHATFRRALTREFMVKRIEALREPTLRIADQLITGMIDSGSPADFVEHIGLPLPSLVICELLGVPYEDHDFFQTKSNVLIDFRSTGEDVAAARQTLGDYLERLIQDKHRDPQDDLLSRLAQQVEDGAFTLRDAADLGWFLLFAGHETTANMIGLSTVALLQNLDQIPRLYEGKAELANAVEELLRYLTIAHAGLRRVATEDVTIGDVTIRAGEGVLISLNSANRDEAVFTDADLLDLTRADARQHVAFGYGIHQCLGQPLARMELQVLLPEIFRRLPHLSIATEDIAFKDTSAAYGVRTLPVTW